MKTTVAWHAETRLWFVRQIDTIGCIKRVGGLFRPARLGVHGKPCKRLAQAVKWIEQREAEMGKDQL